jgi:hypothetical protein
MRLSPFVAKAPPTGRPNVASTVIFGSKFHDLLADDESIAVMEV